MKDKLIQLQNKKLAIFVKERITPYIGFISSLDDLTLTFTVNNKIDFLHHNTTIPIQLSSISEVKEM